MIHLFRHRLGLFEFCGLAKAPDVDINRYLDEVQVQRGLYSAEKTSQENLLLLGDHFLLPSTFSPTEDVSASFLLLSSSTVKEFLHTRIIVCTELPGVLFHQNTNRSTRYKQNRDCGQEREVIHRLASGSKTHSELAEVHHVLSHWDNVYLSEEGKLVNPDDATGAALAAVLSDVAMLQVASRKVFRGKMDPDKRELNNKAWDS
jgi:hypothetical protein